MKFTSLIRKSALTLFFIVLSQMWGCSSAPIQEISDARLTLRTAYEAGASTFAAEALSEAEVFLQRATQKVEEKEYGKARQFAVMARERASAAREIAIHRSHTD